MRIYLQIFDASVSITVLRCTNRDVNVNRCIRFGVTVGRSHGFKLKLRK